MTCTEMELISTLTTRLLEELSKGMLPVRKEWVPALCRHWVVRVFPVVEALAQF